MVSILVNGHPNMMIHLGPADTVLGRPLRQSKLLHDFKGVYLKQLLLTTVLVLFPRQGRKLHLLSSRLRDDY